VNVLTIEKLLEVLEGQLDNERLRREMDQRTEKKIKQK